MVYLDNAATTKVDEEVIEDIVWYLRNRWYNPSSVYEDGLQVKRNLEEARKIIADDIGADPDEIIFTSGGSEANNLAIKGMLLDGVVDTIITTKLEHSSVANIVNSMLGVKFTWRKLSNNKCGQINLDELYSALFMCEPERTLVVINAVNNETGVMQDIYGIANACKQYGVKLHLDMVQGFAHLKTNVRELGLATMSVSAHKWGCPKGVGFLYKRKDVALSPIISGGKQEFGLRGGTENVAYICAMAKQVQRLKDKQFLTIFDLWKEIEKYDIDCDVNCDIDSATPNILSLTFKGVDGQALMTMLNQDGICVSTGSACNEGTNKPSRVLLALGLTEEEARSTIRVSLGFNNTKEDLETFAKSLKKSINMLRR